MSDNTNTAKVLRDLPSDLAKAAKDAGTLDDAGAVDTDEAAGPEIEGLDKEEAAGATDAGAAPNLVLSEKALQRAVLRLEREGLREDKVIELVRQASGIEMVRGHAIGHARGFRKGMEHARRRWGVRGRGMRHENDLLPDEAVFWRRSSAMNAQRWDIIERYKLLHGGAVEAGVGFYYGTLQVPLRVEGPASNPLFVMNVPPPSGSNANPVIDSCFDMAVGDTEEDWFGGPHILDLSDTNLTNPGAFLYPDQLMMVEAVSARLKAIRIQYYPVGTTAAAATALFPLLAPATSPVTNGLMQGTSPVWDKGAVILPIEFFNQYNDVSELAQAVAMVTTLAFAWDDRGTGGNENLAIKPIERMCAVPGSARQGVQETSGAGLTLDLPRAFIWCLDRAFQATEDQGGNGLFSAQLRQSASFGFPFSPISTLFGAPTPTPLGCALEWQLTVHGTSLQPSKRLLERANPRRRT